MAWQPEGAARTPNASFDLDIITRTFPYSPKFATVTPGNLRMAYVDVGSGPVVVLLHGEPTWGFLYRKMIPPLVAGGCRVVVPDLIGFGRSDKPTARSDYSYERHFAWLGSWFEQILPPESGPIVLFCQDWGGLLGLRLVASEPDRFAAVCAANTCLPDGSFRASKGFERWLTFSQTVETFQVGAIIGAGTVNGLDEEAAAAYDAPFAGLPEEAKAGARCFPTLVPVSRWHPGAAENRAFWRSLRAFERPFVTCFSDSDPVSRGGDAVFQQLVAGAAGQAHTTIRGGGHFLQEDCGEELAAALLRVVRGTTAPQPAQAKL